MKDNKFINWLIIILWLISFIWLFAAFNVSDKWAENNCPNVTIWIYASNRWMELKQQWFKVSDTPIWNKSRCYIPLSNWTQKEILVLDKYFLDYAISIQKRENDLIERYKLLKITND